MGEAKPPGAYLHGDGPTCIVIVPARIANWLATRTNLSDVRISARGTDPEVYAVLAALHRAGLAWRTSVTGSAAPAEPEATALSKWMSTTQAAHQLGVTDRAIRLAITQHRLPAENVDGRWRITREDIEHYRAARAA
jgi:excisionase family DNA binding protein